MYDSYSVADTILQDLHSDDDGATPSTRLDWAPSIKSPEQGVPQSVQDCAVKWKDWQRINEAEIAQGQANGKIREKMLTIDEMYEVLGR